MPRRVAAPIVLALLLAAASAGAQDPRVAEARREGKVVWHTALALEAAQRVATRFEQAYAGIKVEVHRSGSERILQRVMQELQAGIKNADVINTSDTGHYVFLTRKGLLARHAPAGSERFPLVIPYNTKLVAPSEAPKAWRDLLDPKWKGRLVSAHPGYAGSVVTQMLALEKLYGADYGFLYLERRKGSPIAASYPRDGVVLIFSPTAITSFAPHPNAARLFTDFIFARDTQQLLADQEGLYVAHPDVTYPPDRPKLGDLKLLIVDPEEIDRRGDEMKKRFVELFGA